MCTLNLCRTRPATAVYYEVIPEIMMREDTGRYKTYGICVHTADAPFVLHDVCVCKKTARYIAARCNRNAVSPIHLADVVTDMLP